MKGAINIFGDNSCLDIKCSASTNRRTATHQQPNKYFFTYHLFPSDTLADKLAFENTLVLCRCMCV